MRTILYGGLLLLAAGLSGCATMALPETRDVAKQVREDQIKFYEYLANSYYLLGYEYFLLAKELEDTNQPERSQQMARLALNYTTLYEDLSASADLLRERYQIAPDENPTQLKVLPEIGEDALVPSTPSEQP